MADNSADAFGDFDGKFALSRPMNVSDLNRINNRIESIQPNYHLGCRMNYHLGRTPSALYSDGSGPVRSTSGGGPHHLGKHGR